MFEQASTLFEHQFLIKKYQKTYSITDRFVKPITYCLLSFFRKKIQHSLIWLLDITEGFLKFSGTKKLGDWNLQSRKCHQSFIILTKVGLLFKEGIRVLAFSSKTIEKSCHFLKAKFRETTLRL